MVYHMGVGYVPASGEIVEEPETQNLLPDERFLDSFIDRVGCSSNLLDRIHSGLKNSGDLVRQITVLPGAIREL